MFLLPGFLNNASTLVASKIHPVSFQNDLLLIWGFIGVFLVVCLGFVYFLFVFKNFVLFFKKYF